MSMEQEIREVAKMAVDAGFIWHERVLSPAHMAANHKCYDAIIAAMREHVDKVVSETTKHFTKETL